MPSRLPLSSLGGESLKDLTSPKASMPKASQAISRLPSGLSNTLRRMPSSSNERPSDAPVPSPHGSSLNSSMSAGHALALARLTSVTQIGVPKRICVLGDATSHGPRCTPAFLRAHLVCCCAFSTFFSALITFRGIGPMTIGLSLTVDSGGT